jgi:hypothetical protein
MNQSLRLASNEGRVGIHVSLRPTSNLYKTVLINSRCEKYIHCGVAMRYVQYMLHAVTTIMCTQSTYQIQVSLKRAELFGPEVSREDCFSKELHIVNSKRLA